MSGKQKKALRNLNITPSAAKENRHHPLYFKTKRLIIGILYFITYYVI